MKRAATCQFGRQPRRRQPGSVRHGRLKIPAISLRDNVLMPVKSPPRERPFLEMLLAEYENGTWKDATRKRLE
jgi:hypothetical protein